MDMFLFYVDESGTGAKDDQTNFFVLAAIAINQEHSIKMYQDTSVLKYSILKKKQPEEWELKARHICQGLEYFKGWKWEARVRVFLEVSKTLKQLPCHIFTVVVNKKLLYEGREKLKDDISLYRLAFSKLLDELDTFLKRSYTKGILLMDSRSTHSTSVQDGRLIKTYRNWVESKEYDTGFIEQPWFGVSQFCVGLQLADYVAHLVDIRSQQLEKDNRKAEFLEAFNMLEEKIYLFGIPPT